MTAAQLHVDYLTSLAFGRLPPAKQTFPSTLPTPPTTLQHQLMETMRNFAANPFLSNPNSTYESLILNPVNQTTFIGPQSTNDHNFGRKVLTGGFPSPPTEKGDILSPIGPTENGVKNGNDITPPQSPFEEKNSPSSPNEKRKLENFDAQLTKRVKTDNDQSLRVNGRDSTKDRVLFSGQLSEELPMSKPSNVELGKEYGRKEEGGSPPLNRKCFIILEV